jgi:ankyrin repeat protein
MSEITLESQLIEIIENKEMAEHIKLAKVDMLIRLGVDVNAMYGAKSALKLANELNETKIAKMLEDNKARDFIDDEKALELGAKLFDNCLEDRFDIKKIKELIDMGADVNATDRIGSTLLMVASFWGHKEVADLLVENKADVNLKDKWNETALMYAARDGYKEIVEILISNGADVGAKNNDGETAIDLAKDDETRDVIKKACKNRFFAKVKRGFGMGE